MVKAKLAELTQELTEDMRALSEMNRRWGRVRAVEADIPREAMTEAGVRRVTVADLDAGFLGSLAKFDEALDAVRVVADPLLSYLELTDRAIRKAGG